VFHHAAEVFVLDVVASAVQRVGHAAAGAAEHARLRHVVANLLRHVFHAAADGRRGVLGLMTDGVTDLAGLLGDGLADRRGGVTDGLAGVAGGLAALVQSLAGLILRLCGLVAGSAALILGGRVHHKPPFDELPALVCPAVPSRVGRNLSEATRMPDAGPSQPDAPARELGPSLASIIHQRAEGLGREGGWGSDSDRLNPQSFLTFRTLMNNAVARRAATGQSRIVKARRVEQAGAPHKAPCRALRRIALSQTPATLYAEPKAHFTSQRHVPSSSALGSASGSSGKRDAPGARRGATP